jgi:hypothetical protein
MRDNPCIFISEEGEPYVLIVTENADAAEKENKAKLRKKFATPGLRGLLIRSVDDLSERPATGMTKLNPVTSIVF